jgi:hypothetical protein
MTEQPSFFRLCLDALGETVRTLFGRGRYDAHPPVYVGRRVAIEFDHRFREAVETALPRLRESMEAAVKSSFSYTYSGAGDNDSITAGYTRLLEDPASSVSPIDGAIYHPEHGLVYPPYDTGSLRPAVRKCGALYDQWHCPYCGSLHPSTAYRCASCGAPRRRDD